MPAVNSKINTKNGRIICNFLFDKGKKINPKEARKNRKPTE